MIKHKKRISFHGADRNVPLKDRTALKKFIADQASGSEYIQLDLTYVFCSDEFLLKINQQHLNHDDYTDIITFDLSENPSQLSGEIYISVDRVKENASGLRLSFQEELHRVIFHGLLHLLGYKDKAPKDKELMTEMENKLLEEWRGRKEDIR